MPRDTGFGFGLGLGLAALALLPLALPLDQYVMGLLVSAFIVAGVALAWALLGNLGGMVSFGHAAFFGIGAYVSALLAARLQVPVLLAIPLGGAAAAVSALVMLPALRLSGAYFALAILAYAEIFRILALQFGTLTGGAAGLTQIPRLPVVLGLDLSSRTGTYGLLLVLIAAALLAYAAVRGSHAGLALRGMAESEAATRMVGVDSTLLKAWMLLFSAFVAGVFGAVNAHVIAFLDPDYAFAGSWSVFPIVAAIFGGFRFLAGPVIGAVCVYLFDQLVAKAIMPVGHEILLGVLLAAVILAAPGGLAGLLAGLLRPKKGTAPHAAA